MKALTWLIFGFSMVELPLCGWLSIILVFDAHFQTGRWKHICSSNTAGSSNSKAIRVSTSEETKIFRALNPE